MSADREPEILCRSCGLTYYKSKAVAQNFRMIGGGLCVCRDCLRETGIRERAVVKEADPDTDLAPREKLAVGRAWR